MRRFYISTCFLALLAILACATPQPVQAQAGSAYDLINEVNNLRASYGLAALTIDGSLMALAQQHSDYQASIQTHTHIRADGTSARNYVSAENIGGGLNVSPQYVIYNQWTDELHMNTMIGFSEGSVGAGVAIVDGYVYYTLDVLRSGSFTNLKPAPPAQTTPGIGTAMPGALTPTVLVIVPVQTATPQPDGAIVHEIQAGQSLWAIATAYGVQINDIAALNGMAPENLVIYPGQKLILRQAFTPTISPTITETPVPPTRTVRPTFTPRPTRPSSTPTVTRTPTKPPLIPEIPLLEGPGSRGLGIAIIVICAIGLVGVIIMSLRGRGQDEE